MILGICICLTGAQHDRKSRLSAAAIRASSFVNIRSVSTVVVAAVRAGELKDILQMICARCSCVADCDLTMPVHVPGFRRTFRHCVGDSGCARHCSLLLVHRSQHKFTLPFEVLLSRRTYAVEVSLHPSNQFSPLIFSERSGSVGNRPLCNRLWVLNNSYWGVSGAKSTLYVVESSFCASSELGRNYCFGSFFNSHEIYRKLSTSSRSPCR